MFEHWRVAFPFMLKSMVCCFWRTDVCCKGDGFHVSCALFISMCTPTAILARKFFTRLASVTLVLPWLSPARVASGSMPLRSTWPKSSSVVQGFLKTSLCCVRLTQVAFTVCSSSMNKRNAPAHMQKHHGVLVDMVCVSGRCSRISTVPNSRINCTPGVSLTLLGNGTTIRC